MITEQQIIEAAKDNFCSTDYGDYTHECYEFSKEELSRFALRFYKQGLLAGAEKCDDLGKGLNKIEPISAVISKAIRAMADEVGK